MFKFMLLGQSHSLSEDAELEQALRVRLDFMVFNRLAAFG
ncbi:MAG: transposase [Pseudomonadota bacterium]|nr:transposase [Pseudomonadota bacterium]